MNTVCLCGWCLPTGRVTWMALGLAHGCPVISTAFFQMHSWSGEQGLAHPVVVVNRGPGKPIKAVFPRSAAVELRNSLKTLHMKPAALPVSRPQEAVCHGYSLLWLFPGDED